MSGIDELAGKSVGERIQIIRERAGKSRPVVAGLVGRSAEWLKAIERGKREAPKLSVLTQLAEALHVADLAELTGETGVQFAVSRREGHPAVGDMRDAIESMTLRLDPEPEPDPAALARRVSDAWQLWHSSPTPRDAVGAVLPAIIRETRRATRVLHGGARRRANVALTGAYALSEQLLAWVTDPALLWLAADRCMIAAEQADDPEALALASWVLGNVWRATGREEDALDLAVDATRLLDPHLDGSEHMRALWGACQLHASITAAKLGRQGDAERHLDQGVDMAAAMPAAYTEPWTMFGTANAALTGVSVQVDLRKGKHALDAADQVDIDAIPSVDRRARLWLETARAYHQRKDGTAALHVLQRAANVSTESMRCHPLARTIAGELVTTGGPLVQREARGLASQLGVTV